jgi:SNF2 family DNA or RNA helicase
VSIKFKRLFTKVSKSGGGQSSLVDNLETRHDLLWFMDRYPLEISEADLETLRGGRATYLEDQAKGDAILAAEYVPRQYEMALPLRDYQARAVDLYIQRKRLLVADDVGMGKTPLAVASFTDKTLLPALVVTQTHLGSQWVDQIKKFIPGARVFLTRNRSLNEFPLEDHDVYVTTYSRFIGWRWALEGARFSDDPEKDAMSMALSNGFFKSIVFDEMQELRRPSAEKYSVATLLVAKATHTLGLTATPIYNYADEIFHVLDLVEPGVLGSYEEFQREWCSYDVYKSRSLVKDTAALKAFLREKNVLIRRTRKDVQRELPPVQKQIIEVDYDEEAMEQAIQSSADLAARVLTGTSKERFSASGQLDNMIRSETGVAKAKQVATFVRGLLECGEKVLLVAWHRPVYEIYNRELKDFKPVMYTGTENAVEKEKSRQAFVKGDSQVMLMSLWSGSGLDGLQEVCDIIVFGELDYSPGRMAQCIGRLARDGVRKSVVAYFLIANGGSDPIMVDILGLKAAQADGLMGDSKGDEAKGGDFGEANQELNLARVKDLARLVLKKAGREVQETIDVAANPVTAGMESQESPRVPKELPHAGTDTTQKTEATKNGNPQKSEKETHSPGPTIEIEAVPKDRKEKRRKEKVVAEGYSVTVDLFEID